MTSSAGPEILCIGQARLTAGLDRTARIDLTTHQAVFGTLPRLTVDQLIEMAAAEPDLDLSEAWIAEISDVRRQIPHPIS
jgi:hypothetical protein